jgi:hypothetical protein
MRSTRYGLPVIQVTENSQVVEMLLQFCYLITIACASALTTVEEILPLMEAAIKYSIEGVEHCARDALIKPPLVEENPMQSCTSTDEEEKLELLLDTLSDSLLSPQERCDISQLEARVH